MPPGEYQEKNPRRHSSYSSLIAGALLVVLAVAGYFGWQALSNRAPAEPAQTPQEQVPVVQSTTYASSTMKFSVSYPPKFTLEEPYAYTRVSPTKPISGVKFRVPASFTQGTDLASDSGVSIEQLPRANACAGDIYLKANVKAAPFADGTINYSVATSTEALGSDTFEEAIFAVTGSSPCIAVRYFLHTTAATGTATSTRAYDRAGLLAAFETIRRSLSVQ